MNNANSQALLARIRPGMLVTVKSVNGTTVTGRARPFADTAGYVIDTGSRRGIGVNSGNIVRVQP